MSEIQFMEKPDWVSWEAVSECIRKANVVNDKKGFHMLFANRKTEELIEELKNGHCFVALKDKQVIGTASFFIRYLRRWWVWGNVIYYSDDGILPEYRGTDVYFKLVELRDKYVDQTGLKIRQFNTAEHNKPVIKINKFYGYKLVHFTPTKKGADYYSVTMVRWDDGCPFPDWFLRFMFNLTKMVSKTLWKPGYKRRFWFN